MGLFTEQPVFLGDPPKVRVRIILVYTYVITRDLDGVRASIVYTYLICTLTLYNNKNYRCISETELS